MKRFVEGEDRRQVTLLPECLDDYVAPDNPVRIVEAFVDELDLVALGFAGMIPEATGRPAYHPATLLKIYIYGYLNRIPSSRRLERETQRNLELIWLTGRLMPDFKTIADFRRDNGPAIRTACAQFIGLCRKLNLFTRAVVALDGSKFKAVNNRDKNFTVAKVAKRIEQVEAGIARYLAALDRADRQGGAQTEARATRLKLPYVPKTQTSGNTNRGLFPGQDFVYDAEHDRYTCPAGQHLTKGKVRSDRRDNIDHSRNLTACPSCALKPRCTPDKHKRVKRWQHEDVLDRMQVRLERRPCSFAGRRWSIHSGPSRRGWAVRIS